MAKLRGLNKVYYNMNIETGVVDEHEVNMLKSLKADCWTDRLKLMDYTGSKGDFNDDHNNTVKQLKKLDDLAKLWKE